jgi:hypothetical protein
MLILMQLQYFALLIFVLFYCVSFLIHRAHKIFVIRKIAKIRKHELHIRRRHPYIIERNATLKN